MHAKTHRHFVAVPLSVLFLLVIAGVQSTLSVLASDLTGAAAVRHDLELAQGESLIRSAGLTEHRLGAARVHALGASFVALHDAASSTVVPLTAPVMVTRESEAVLVVPGMQLLIRSTGDMTLSTVPAAWYKERLHSAKLVPEIASSVDPGEPQAELSQIVRDGRITMVSYARAFEIAKALDPSGIALQLLQVRLLQEEQRTDDGVSLTLAKTIAENAVMSEQLVSALPVLVGTLQKPVAEAHIDGWALRALAVGLADSERILALLHRRAMFPHELARAGYPRQSRLWQHALLSVGTTLRTTLSEQQRTSLDADLAVVIRGDVVSAPPQELSPAARRLTTHWTPDVLSALVSEMLLTHGVLMGTTTELVPDIAAQTVRVTGVFLSQEGRDVPYAFTVDVSGTQVRDILRDGQRLPNAVPIDVFFP